MMKTAVIAMLLMTGALVAIPQASALRCVSTDPNAIVQCETNDVWIHGTTETRYETLGYLVANRDVGCLLP